MNKETITYATDELRIMSIKSSEFKEYMATAMVEERTRTDNNTKTKKQKIKTKLAQRSKN